MYEFVHGILRRERIREGWDAKSGLDAEGFDGCERRVTINQKPNLTNPVTR